MALSGYGKRLFHIGCAPGGDSSGVEYRAGENFYRSNIADINVTRRPFLHNLARFFAYLEAVKKGVLHCAKKVAINFQSGDSSSTYTPKTKISRS